MPLLGIFCLVMFLKSFPDVLHKHFRVKKTLFKVLNIQTKLHFSTHFSENVVCSS